MFTPSKYQQAIFDFVVSGEGHGLIDAVPGSGKTTTLIEAAKLLTTDNAIFLAFNRHIAVELDGRLKAQGSSMRAMTIHQLGNSALRSLGVRFQSPNDKKYTDLCKQYLLSQNAYDYSLLTLMKKIVSFTQLTMTPAADESALWSMVEHYGLSDEINRRDPEWSTIWQGINRVLQEGLKLIKTGIIDFNDMVWGPVMLHLSPAKADWIFVDECQDLNAAQLALVTSAVNGSGRLLFVGDKHQSLYGFAGADTHSVDTIIEKTHATVLPLSICYRCPTSHVNLCADIFPGIEASPTASEGTIDYVATPSLASMMQPGDLVLCRVTAPLVSMCLELLRNGVRATVRGRDIGKSIVDQVNKVAKIPGFTFDAFGDFVYKYREAQVLGLLSDKDADMKIAALEDKIDTILALHGAYLAQQTFPSLENFKTYIESFFSDELGGYVVLSTVHKAKGLEENRVFILKPELMPFPKAKQGWQIEQEWNIKYVALSRSKQDLYFVMDSVPTREITPESLLDAISEETPSITQPEEIPPSLELPVNDTTTKKMGRPKGSKNKVQREEKEHLHITLPVEIYNAAKVKADLTGVNLSDVIASLLSAWVAETTPESEELPESNPFDDEFLTYALR